MAIIANPRKHFQFDICIPGLNSMLAQKVHTPDNELDVVEHGDRGFLVKTAGLIKITTLKIEKIQSADTLDLFMYNWAQQIRNTITGGGAVPQVYKQSIMIQQYATDGLTVIQTWLCKGAWPHKINGIEFSRITSDNTIENVDLCVDEMPVF